MHFSLFIKTFANIERWHIFVDINVISFKFFLYNIHDSCAALPCLTNKEFGTCDTICINTNVFLIPVRDIVRFDAIVGKALANSRDVGLRVLKVHELGLEVPKLHESCWLKFNVTPSVTNVCNANYFRW